MLDGRVTFHAGDASEPAGPGDYAYGPRNVPQRFEVGDEGCRMLFILTPGGLDELIMATSEPAGSRMLPPQPGEALDVDRLKAIVARYGCELLI